MTSYITRVDGYIESICDSAECALSHLIVSLPYCMVSVQGQSFHADHVTEEMMLDELETSGELHFDYKSINKLTVVIARTTQPQQQTS